MSLRLRFSLICISVVFSNMANAQSYLKEWKRMGSTVHSGIIEFKHILLSKNFLKNPEAIDLEALESRFCDEDFELSQFCSEFLDSEQLPFDTPWDEIKISFNEVASRQDRRQPYRDDDHQSHSILLYTQESESIIHQRLSGRKQVQIVSGSFPPEMYRFDDVVFFPHMETIEEVSSSPSEYHDDVLQLTFRSSARDNIAEIDPKTGFIYRYAAHFHSGELAELILQESPVSIDGYTLPSRRLNLTVGSEGIKQLRLVSLVGACLNCDPGDVFNLTAEPRVPIFDHRSADGGRSIVIPHEPLNLPDLTSMRATDAAVSNWKTWVIIAVNTAAIFLIVLIVVRERLRKRSKSSNVQSSE